MAVDPLGAGGHRRGVGPEGALAAQQVERRAAQQPQYLAPVMVLQHLAILSEAVVGDVEPPVLDPPMPSGDRQQPGRVGRVGAKTGHEVAGHPGDLARGELDHLLSQFGDLGQSRERGVADKVRPHPQFAPLQATVSLLRRYDVGRAGFGEEDRDVSEEDRLVFLSRKT